MTTYTAPDGRPLVGDEIWKATPDLFRTRTALAVSHGVADAIDGVQREQREDTVYRAPYWRAYRRGQRDWAEAAERNQREAPARSR